MNYQSPYNKYIGKRYPTNGGCWDLAKEVLFEQFNIHLQDEFDPEAFKKIDSPRPGDLALFMVQGQPAHIGVVIGPGRFIHYVDGTETSISHYTHGSWQSRLEGFYRRK